MFGVQIINELLYFGLDKQYYLSSLFLFIIIMLKISVTVFFAAYQLLAWAWLAKQRSKLSCQKSSPAKPCTEKNEKKCEVPLCHSAKK